MSEEPEVHAPPPPEVSGFGKAGRRNKLAGLMATAQSPVETSAQPAEVPHQLFEQPATPDASVPEQPQDAKAPADRRGAQPPTPAPSPATGSADGREPAAAQPEGLVLDVQAAAATDEGYTREVKPLVPVSIAERYTRTQRHRAVPGAVIVMDAVDHCYQQGILVTAIQRKLASPPRPAGSLFPSARLTRRRIPKTERETQISFRLTDGERAALDGVCASLQQQVGRSVPMSLLVAVCLDGFLPGRRAAATLSRESNA